MWRRKNKPKEKKNQLERRKKLFLRPKEMKILPLLQQS